MKELIFSKVANFRPALNFFTRLFSGTAPIAACYSKFTKTELLLRYFARIMTKDSLSNI